MFYFKVIKSKIVSGAKKVRFVQNVHIRVSPVVRRAAYRCYICFSIRAVRRGFRQNAVKRSAYYNSIRRPSFAVRRHPSQSGRFEYLDNDLDLESPNFPGMSVPTCSTATLDRKSSATSGRHFS